MKERLADFNAAAALLQSLRQGRELILVAIDGHSAAGKSTLAAGLQALCPEVQLVHGDDFYRVMPETERFDLDASEGYRRYFDWERLEQQVLRPLATLQEARYSVYDWATGALSDTKIVRPLGTVIIEGVFSARPELRRYYDAIFLVETNERIRAERQKQRGDETAWLARWDAAEKFYLETHRPHTYADLVIAPE